MKCCQRLSVDFVIVAGSMESSILFHCPHALWSAGQQFRTASSRDHKFCWNSIPFETPIICLIASHWLAFCLRSHTFQPANVTTLRRCVCVKPRNYSLQEFPLIQFNGFGIQINSIQITDIFELRTHAQFRSREVNYTFKKLVSFRNEKKSTIWSVDCLDLPVDAIYNFDVFFVIQKKRVCEWNREWNYGTLVNAFQNILLRWRSGTFVVVFKFY